MVRVNSEHKNLDALLRTSFANRAAKSQSQCLKSDGLA